MDPCTHKTEQRHRRQNATLDTRILLTVSNKPRAKGYVFLIFFLRYLKNQPMNAAIRQVEVGTLFSCILVFASGLTRVRKCRYFTTVTFFSTLTVVI